MRDSTGYRVRKQRSLAIQKYGHKIEVHPIITLSFSQDQPSDERIETSLVGSLLTILPYYSRVKILLSRIAGQDRDNEVLAPVVSLISMQGLPAEDDETSVPVEHV